MSIFLHFQWFESLSKLHYTHTHILFRVLFGNNIMLRCFNYEKSLFLFVLVNIVLRPQTLVRYYDALRSAVRAGTTKLASENSNSCKLGSLHTVKI